MEFGNGRSLQWLVSILVSIIEDIFVMQPLKVLVLALIFALFVRKPYEGEFKILAGDQPPRDNEEMEMVSRAPSAPLIEKSGVFPAMPPDAGLLNKARKRRIKERKMTNLINEIIIHLIFITIIAMVTYGHKDSSANTLHQHLEGLETNTSKILNINGVWNWTRDILIPTAFPDQLYNMADVPEYGFFDDQYNNLISRARMRLLRMKEDACILPDEYKSIFQSCTRDYSIFDQDEKCYKKNWTIPSSVSTIPSSVDTIPPSVDTIPPSVIPWCFQTWRTLDGFPIWGIFTTYSGSGYITELTPGKNNHHLANTMEQLNWLDKQTRALVIELTVYNANVNQFTAITLLFEFPSYGGVFHSTRIQPMRLNVYVGGFAFFIFACEIIFLLFIAVCLYAALKKIYHKKRAYFGDFWNLIDFSILISSLAAIAVYVYRIGLIEKLMKRVEELDGKFVNFQYITMVNEVFNCIIALVITITTIKLTKLMRFNLRVSLFGMTLQRARPALVCFTLQFGIVAFAFVMLGTLAFGRNVDGYKNIPSTMLSLGRVILGKNEFIELPSIDRVLGPLFFFTYIVLVCWILMCMFLVILIDAYHQVQYECCNMTNDYEILDFIIDKLRGWSGMGHRKVVRINAHRRWQRARIRVKAVNTLGQRRRYLPSHEDEVLERTSDLMDQLEHSIRQLEMRVNRLN